MERGVSAAEANRKFSKLLRTVREGHSYLVTSHGKGDSAKQLEQLSLLRFLVPRPDGIVPPELCMSF